MRALVLSLLLFSCAVAERAPVDGDHELVYSHFRDHVRNLAPGCITVRAVEGGGVINGGAMSDCSWGEDVIIYCPRDEYCRFTMNRTCSCDDHSWQIELLLPGDIDQ